MVKEHLSMVGGVSGFLRSVKLRTYRPACATASGYGRKFFCVAVSGRS